ncbi:MAG: Uma2 family endonuclease [Kutzneria sp.]|nr:Uma2 family endonuclease [Kutzneria sp.]
MTLHSDAESTLAAWQPEAMDQESLRQAFLGFLSARADACLRACEPGHLTASAVVLDAEAERVLLTLHPRVRRWLQLGGHCEPTDPTLVAAALREATEESGIDGLAIDPVPLHVDVHPITCSLGVPTRHFDVRFAVTAPVGAKAVRSAESTDLRWWPVDALPSDVDTVPELVGLALSRRRQERRAAMSATLWPDDLLTFDEWLALPEDTSRRFELVEGILQTTPRLLPLHQLVIKRLSRQLGSAWEPSGLETCPDVDVVLVEQFPPIVRAPDLVVTSTALLDGAPKRFSAQDVMLVVEVISPGSARTDRITKLAEYAEFGIPHYWIVDIARRATLDAYELVAGSYRQNVTAGTGQVSVTSPAPVTLDLDSLVP